MAKPAPAPVENQGATKQGAEEATTRPRLAGLLALLAFLIGLLYAAPVQDAVQSPILGLIYGFSLWEAWKINKGLRLAFNGPFRVGITGPGSAAAEDAGDGG